MKKVIIIHTSLISYDDLQSLFAEIIPEAEITNIIDESLLKEVKTNGEVTPFILERMCSYFQYADRIGTDLIFNQCSSVSEAAEFASKTIKTPILKVDEAMAAKAVSIGTNIAVVATVGSTMGPSVRLVESEAKKVDKEINITEYLIDGAMDVLMKEGKEKHNELVLSSVKKAASENDVVVLAQGSMMALEPYLSDMPVPVLISPRLGVERAKEMLGL